MASPIELSTCQMPLCYQLVRQFDERRLEGRQNRIQEEALWQAKAALQCFGIAQCSGFGLMMIVAK